MRLLRRPHWLIVAIVVCGLLITGGLAWGVSRVDRNTEQRLLNVQTRQASLVLTTAIMAIEQPMQAALRVQATSASIADTQSFETAMSATTGAGRQFVSASLWKATPTGFAQVTSIGETAESVPGGPEIQRQLKRAMSVSTSVVRQVEMGDRTRLAYALADITTGLVVYAEREVPADRQARVDSDSAFANLDYAMYLGPDAKSSRLLATVVDPADLPLTGAVARQSIPFGDTVLTLVTSPRHHLGSSLSRRLPFLVIAGGILLTLVGAVVARSLVRSSLRAHGMFGQLQRALLPSRLPVIPGLESASEYVAGAEGVDIGGDWYSVVGTGESRFAFVVGDVSGQGLEAVAVMAHVRFALRAYLVEGDAPETALEKCSRQLDISTDGHFTTVLVGVGDSRTGEVRVACAGHPLPLLLSEGDAEFVTIPVGPPLGTGATSYPAITFTMPVGASLVAYTDGLIERRSESIDVGMQRLAQVAAEAADRPVHALVAHVVGSLRGRHAADDIATLVLRRVSV